MTAREWFKRAESEGFAIGAFNVDNLDILRAICIAGRNKKSPVMLEFSPGEVGYFGLKNIASLVNNAREEYQIPILLNLDHAKKVEDCLAALRLRSGLRLGGPDSRRSDDSVSFDDVHFDGSELPFEENIENTKAVSGKAHEAGLLVEGEIDRVPGSSEVHTQDLDLEILKKSYTDPKRTAEFVEKTGIDIFAAVFGNVHGTYPAQPDLDLELLGAIRKVLPGIFLSMHGGSGIPADQVKEAIKVGRIVKVNVNTEIRQAFKDALVEKLEERPDEYSYYKIIEDVVMAVVAVVEAKIDVFGSAGRAS